MGGVFFACAAEFFSKEKKEKKKAHYKGLDKWMQAFRLKNFLYKFINSKRNNRKNFKRNPEGLNLQERKTCP